MRVSITEKDGSLRITDAQEICCELKDGTVYIITQDGLVQPSPYCSPDTASNYDVGTAPMRRQRLVP